MKGDWRYMQTGTEGQGNGYIFCCKLLIVYDQSGNGALKALCRLYSSVRPSRVGGTVTSYFSWSVMQGGLGIMGLVVWAVVLLFLPETSRPGARDVDQLRLKEGKTGVSGLFL